MKLAQKELAKHYIIDCNIKRFTNEESLYYVRSKGIAISMTTLKALKSEIKEDARNWITYMAKSRNAYIALYKESIDELDLLNKKMWSIVEDDHKPDTVKIMAGHLIKSTKREIVQLYDAMPIVQAMRDIEIGDNTIVIEKPKQESDD